MVEPEGESRALEVARGGIRARRRSVGCGHRRDVGETLGKKITAKGVYRDPIRSTHENFVKSSGLRWVCAMLLVEIPWASHVWALPFLSVLAPSERVMPPRGADNTREDNRVGLAAALAGKALVSGTRDRYGGGQRLRLSL